jgi:hypothetical protein
MLLKVLNVFFREDHSCWSIGFEYLQDIWGDIERALN